MEQTTNGNTLELSGSLDVRCTAELRAAVYRLLEQHAGDVRVDISRVESVDLTTLKMLAVANRVAERQGHRVVLSGGSPGVRRLLHLSHLRWMLPVEPGGHSTVA
jgi:anti-anti-sigma factor